MAVVAVLFLTNWPTYQYAVRGGPIPLYFYVLPLLFIVPLSFAEPAAVVRTMREPLFWWFVVYVVTGLLWLLPAQDFLEDASRQWRLRVLALLFFFPVAMLAAEAHRRTAVWVIVGCVLLATAFNWFDVLRPFRFVPQGVEGASEGRGAGLFINPNAAGSFIVMGAIAALPMIPGKLRGLLLVCAVFGVAATFSRGAFIMVFVAVVGAVWLGLVKRAQGILLAIGLPLVIAGVSLSYDYVIDKSESRHVHNIVERLNWFQNAQDEDMAVEGRKYGARRAWEFYLESPVLGAGVGVSSRAEVQEGSHNMYLLLLAEQGLVGAALYISLVVLLVTRGRRVARAARTPAGRDAGRTLVLMGAFLATYGFFSHNVLEEPHSMFLLAFAAATATAALGARPTSVAHGRGVPAGEPGMRSPA